MPTETNASVCTADVSIVVFDELDVVFQPQGLGSLARICNLLPRDIERPDFHAVVTRHIQREATPAAASASATIWPGRSRNLRHTCSILAFCA